MAYEGDVMAFFSLQIWRSRGFAHFLLFVTALVWGVAFVFQKTGMQDIGAMNFVFYRFLVGAIALAPFAYLEHQRRGFFASISGGAAGLTPRQLVWGAGGLGGLMFLGSVMQQVSLHTASIANVAFLTALYVPLVPILGLVLFRVRLPWVRWLAVAVFLAGSWLMTGASFRSINSGEIIVLISAIFWAFHIMLVGALVMRSHIPFQLAFLQTAITSLLALLVCMAMGRVEFVLVLQVLPDILFAGVVSLGLGFTLQMVAQQNCSPSAAAIILSLEGVIAAIAGHIILGQVMTGIAMVGAGMIMLAVLLVELSPTHHQYKHGKSA